MTITAPKVFILFILLLLTIFSFSLNRSISALKSEFEGIGQELTQQDPKSEEDIYKKGANDALRELLWLDIQLHIKGETWTWKEKAKTIRRRMKIQKP